MFGRKPYSLGKQRQSVRTVTFRKFPSNASKLNQISAEWFGIFFIGNVRFEQEKKNGWFPSVFIYEVIIRHSKKFCPQP